MVSVITGSCLITGDLERVQREHSFNNEYLDFEFGETHQKEVGDDIAGLGYPDDGNGRYMQPKSYPEWYL